MDADKTAYLQHAPVTRMKAVTETRFYQESQEELHCKLQGLLFPPGTLHTGRLNIRVNCALKNPIKNKQTVLFLSKCETCYTAKCLIQTTALWTQPITSRPSCRVFTFRVAARLMSFPSRVLWVFFIYFFIFLGSILFTVADLRAAKRSDEPLFAVGSRRFPCSKHTSAILDSIPWKVTSHPHAEAQPDTTKWEVFSTFTRWFFKNDD